MIFLCGAAGGVGGEGGGGGGCTDVGDGQGQDGGGLSRGVVGYAAAVDASWREAGVRATLRGRVREGGGERGGGDGGGGDGGR